MRFDPLAVAAGTLVVADELNILHTRIK